jgi:competence protein ComFB
MALSDDYDFENLKNMSETHVFNELESQLNDYPLPLCRCNDCVGDMAAIALNKTPPKYRWTLLGNLYEAALFDDEAYREAVREAVRGAIETVRQNPSHDRLPWPKTVE